MERTRGKKLSQKVPSPMNADEWEIWWWRKHYSICLECPGECKQSAGIEDLYCPQYKEKQ